MEYLSIAISLITLVVSLSMYNKVSAIEARIKAMQVNYDHISKQGQDGLPPHPVHDEMIQLIREGKEVSAIKKAREVLGMSLVEAKQYVDNLEAK
ncbi:hypothetical protein ABE142_08955 [Paenibacillus alvei]|uniref:hypothetical protein n=1 Tax=Paenibacillus alvei TaxID=44250 RepID=UPI003D2C7969